MEIHFGDADTVMEYALNNPPLVLRHVFTNALSFPRRAAAMIFAPSQYYGKNYRYSRLFGCHILALFAFAMLAFGNLTFVEISKAWKSSIQLISSTSILIIPPIIATFLIYPRDHYLLLLIVPVFGSVLILTRGCCLQIERYRLFVSLAIGVFFLMSTSSVYLPTTNMPTIATIKFLASLQPKEKVNMLEAQGGFNFYLGRNWRRVEQYDKKEPFESFLLKKRVNMILITEKLTNDSRFQSDEEWLNFLSDPERLNFSRISIPGTTWELLICNNLLEPSGEEALNQLRSPLRD